MSFYVSCGPDVRSQAFCDPGRTLVRSSRPNTSPVRGNMSLTSSFGGGMGMSLTGGAGGNSALSTLVRPRTSQTLRGTPNLPGYMSNRIRPHPQHGFRATQSFKTLRGVRVEETDRMATKAAAVNVSRGIAQCSSFGSEVWGNEREPTPRARNDMPLLSNRSSRWLNMSNQVLQFDGYFSEPIYESRFETSRVRRCRIYYYLVNNTVEVLERKQENSGIPQGTVLGRCKMPYEVQHYLGGATLDFYGKKITIINCNGSTRAYLERMGVDFGAALPWPQDAYSTMHAEKVAREAAGHGVPRNPMKKYLEATLGNTIQSQLGGRGQFLAQDRKVLRFLGLWDDSRSLFGEKIQYTIHYYLADDTVEVLEVHPPNCGKDPFPLMLKRCKLPRNALVDDSQGRDDEQPSSDFYNWRDFKIGSIVKVFQREVKILSVDAATRAYYEEQGIDVGEDSALEPAPAPTYSRAPPAWNPTIPGAGGEEDSLQNCYSLVPKAPKTEFEKQWRKTKGKVEERTLRFKARLDSDAYDQKCREFVISYNVLDNSVQVAELKVRNSGVMGGMFLRRQRYKNADTGNFFAITDFKKGTKVKMNTFVLIVTDVDRATQAYIDNL